MTAIAERRTRRTYLAAGLAGGLSLLAVVMLVVGTVTLSNSREGEAVGIDDRPHDRFPATSNGVLAVTDDEGELTSVVVLTLLPTGQGGSIVTVPVNADSSAGFGLERLPLDESFDADDPESIVTPLENMLSITIQRSLIVDPAGLAELLEPIGSVEVDVPHDVIDAAASDAETDDSGEEQDGGASDDRGGDDALGEEADVNGTADLDADDVVVAAGERTLDAEQIADALTATDTNAPDYDQHDIEAAVWAAMASSAPASAPSTAAAPSGAAGSVAPDPAAGSAAPVDVEELLERMWQGEVGVRDVTLATLAAADNPDDLDVVLLDRRDTSLIFAQISPGLVSTPGGGLNIRVVAGFDDEQIAESAGLFETTSDLLRTFIGEMLAVENTVVSADSAPTGAPEVTVVEVSSEQFLADTELAAEALFGEAEVRLAERVLDGVDIHVTLGMTYIERELDLLALAILADDAEGSGESVPANSTDPSTPTSAGVSSAPASGRDSDEDDE